MNLSLARTALLMAAVVAPSLAQLRLPPDTTPERGMSAEEKAQWRERRLEAIRKEEARDWRMDPQDQLRQRIAKRTFPKPGDPPTQPKKSFEGFVLDDENLEREIFEAIQAGALLARKLVPMRREKAEIEQRILALPPIDRTKPYIAGAKRGPEIEMAALNVKVAEALAAEKRVGSIVWTLNQNQDVRNLRVFACLLWEPGEYTTISGDAGHTYLQFEARGQIWWLKQRGALDLDKLPGSDTKWREWWLNNRWKWGWSYEVEPITDTKEFPTPEESGFVPRVAPPPPTATPAPTPIPQTVSVPPPVVAPPEPTRPNALLYAALGAVALLLATALFFRRGKGK